MENEQSSRIAEITMELFGAKAVTELLERVWKDASEDTRRTLADAVVAKILKQLEEPGFVTRNIFESYVRRVVLDVFEKQAVDARVRETAIPKVEALVPQIVDDVVAAAVKDVARDIREKVKDKLRAY